MKLAQFKPDLVVVNTKMSGVERLDLCRRPKRERQEVKILAFEALWEGRGPPQGMHPSNLDGLKERIGDLLGERPSGGSSNV